MSHAFSGRAHPRTPSPTKKAEALPASFADPTTPPVHLRAGHHVTPNRPLRTPASPYTPRPAEGRGQQQQHPPLHPFHLPVASPPQYPSPLPAAHRGGRQPVARYTVSVDTEHEPVGRPRPSEDVKRDRAPFKGAAVQVLSDAVWHREPYDVLPAAPPPPPEPQAPDLLDLIPHTAASEWRSRARKKPHQRTLPHGQGPEELVHFVESLKITYADKAHFVIHPPDTGQAVQEPPREEDFEEEEEDYAAWEDYEAQQQYYAQYNEEAIQKMEQLVASMREYRRAVPVADYLAHLKKALKAGLPDEYHQYFLNEYHEIINDQMRRRQQQQRAMQSEDYIAEGKQRKEKKEKKEKKGKKEKRRKEEEEGGGEGAKEEGKSAAPLPLDPMFGDTTESVEESARGEI